MFIEIAIVVLLTLVNGLLAMSELAIVSARPARLKVMAERGSHRAEIAIRLAEDPGRFLSSVQIGITLVGVLSGAFSGATLGVRLAGALQDWGMSAAAANTLGMGGVVVAITYLSLIMGELVPKQIALRAPESVAVRVAPMMLLIARVAAPLVWILDKSGKLVLRLLGQSGATEQGMSDEEIKLMISEAEHSGVIEHAESRMIEGVMRVADRTARLLMTPRNEVEFVEITDTPATLIKRFRETDMARLVVRDGETILGAVTLRDLLHLAPGDHGFDLRRDLTPAPFIHESMPALDVIEALRGSPARMLLVFDEYGSFEGIVTAMDVLESITGEFSGDDPTESKLTRRSDGSLLVAGWMPADEFADVIGVSLPSGRDFATVAGFVIDQHGDLPKAGDHIDIKGWRIEVIDLDGRRIDKLLVWRL